MSQQEKNIAATRAAYQAFASGDLNQVLNLLDESCEWIQPGQSAISGTYRGRDEIQELLQRFTTKQTRLNPTRFVADGDTVVTMVDGTIGGEPTQSVQVTTWRDGRMARIETYGDTALAERIFGRSRAHQSQSNS
jgi:uncharacterized protein